METRTIFTGESSFILVVHNNQSMWVYSRNSQISSSFSSHWKIETAIIVPLVFIDTILIICLVYENDLHCDLNLIFLIALYRLMFLSFLISTQKLLITSATFCLALIDYSRTKIKLQLILSCNPCTNRKNDNQETEKRQRLRLFISCHPCSSESVCDTDIVIVFRFTLSWDVYYYLPLCRKSTDEKSVTRSHMENCASRFLTDTSSNNQDQEIFVKMEESNNNWRKGVNDKNREKTNLQLDTETWTYFSPRRSSRKKRTGASQSKTINVNLYHTKKVKRENWWW